MQSRTVTNGGPERGVKKCLSNLEGGRAGVCGNRACPIVSAGRMCSCVLWAVVGSLQSLMFTPNKHEENHGYNQCFQMHS